MHHACLKYEYYEYKASGQAVGDGNIRLWNGEGSCARAGYPCIDCTAPEFEESHHTFTQTPKVAEIPTGLPTDMLKAPIVALASL